MKSRYLTGLAVAIALAVGATALVQVSRQGASPANSPSDNARPSFAFGGSYHSSGWAYPYNGFGYPNGVFDPPMPMLDAKHARNADVQDALSKAGSYKGSADGLLSKNTRAAISAYQRDKGLPVTGTVNTELLRSLGLK
jgi:hypothetical protein